MCETILSAEFRTLLSDDEFLARDIVYSNDGQTVIEENFLRNGYKKTNRRDRLDFEECAICLQTLAKFHAASVKIHETNPQIIECAGIKTYSNYCFSLNPKLRINYPKYFLDTVANADVDFATQHSESLRKYANRLFLSAADALRPIENELNVLNHGDFRCGNIIFKYDKFDRVSDAKMYIDFQICRWTSPVIDFIYFIVKATKTDVFEKYFNLLLEIYANTFNGVMRYLKCQREPISTDKLRRITESKYEYWVVLSCFPTAAVRLTEHEPENDDLTRWDDIAFDANESSIRISKRWISYFIQKGVFTKNNDAVYAMRAYFRKLRRENRIEIINYELNDNIVQIGDGYSSRVSRLRFEYIDDKKSIYRKSIVLKIPSLSVSYEFTKSFHVYAKEAYVTIELLPKIRRLYGNVNSLTPIYYQCLDDEILLLEDLAVSGFIVLNKIAQMDEHHCRIALKTLARFHATSYKYLKSNADDSVRVKNVLSAKIDTKLIEYLVDYSYGTIETIIPFISESIAVKLANYKEVMWSKTVPIFQRCWDGRNVIIHGDYWNSNILFRYDDGGSVCESKIIDWQLCRINSPVIDVINLLVSSVKFEIIEKFIETFFDLYLNEFNATLKRLDCDQIYTRDEFDADMKSLNFYYVNVILYALPLTLGQQSGIRVEYSKNSDTPSTLYPVSSTYFIPFVVKWLEFIDSRGIL